MNCPECHFENPEGAHFCNECGHSFSSFPKDFSPFDEKLANIQRYLPRGITEKVLNQKDKLEGERRQVTVMFCDMEGFTHLVDMLGSEEAYRIMDQVYEILIHGVHEFEGTVNEMTGDGVMALFGAPIALEDAPQRALRSAISIHRDMANFSAENKDIQPIKMRIGIHTGFVIVGTLGNNLRVEFKAVGDTVNLASRMEKLAEAGSTYVTEETFKQTKELFRFGNVGKKSVKGKKQSIQVYKVLSAKKDVYRPRLGAERRIYSKMVGRGQELDRLELQVMKVINGEGSVVNIIGEAGIGKSRLVSELKKRDVVKRIALFEGRAIAIGRNLNFHPIIDLLKQWARIREDDGEAMALGKLEAAVRNLDPENFSEVLPFVATLMGMNLSGKNAERIQGIEGEALENLILKNLRELVIKATQQTPLVFVLEDLQWADTSSIELMESLFRLAETQRILFINVFRPGHKETGERIVETVKEALPVYYVEIWLQPLDELNSEALITNMLNIGEIHHAIVGKIVRRACGNPFFMEEVVRSLIDQRAIVLKNGTFQVTERIGDVAIPNTINDVLMARIDRLEDESRKLVKIASVIGRSFFSRILSEVAGSVKEREDKLAYLKQAEFIGERKRMGEVEFHFKHALTQEAAYGSILPRKRKELHLKVALSIEKVFKNKLHEFYGILSYHFINAEDLDKAEYYMLLAGDEAMKSSASNEALNYYKRALELYIDKYGDAADIRKIAGLEENIATAFFNKGYFVEAVKYFERSLKNYGVKIGTNPILLALELFINLLSILKSLYLGQIKKKKIPTKLDDRIMNVKFKLAVSLAYVDIKRVFLENIRNVPQSFKFETKKSPIYFNVLIGGAALFAVTGISFKLSKKILDYAKNSILDNDDKTLPPIHFYGFIVSLYSCLAGEWEQDIKEEFIDNTLKIGDVSSASGYLVWLGYSKIEMGDFKVTEKIITMLKNIDEKYNFSHAKLDFYFLSAKLSMKKGALQSAAEFIDSGIILIDKIGLDMRKIEFLGLKSRILALRNDLDYAAQIIKTAEDFISVIGKTAILTNYYGEYLIGKFLYNLCKLENCIKYGNASDFSEFKNTSLEVGKQSVKHFRKKVAVGRTETFSLMGRYYWLINKPKKAIRWWNKSIQEGLRLKAKLELSKTYLEVGKRLTEKSNWHKKYKGFEGKYYLDLAKTIFNELNLESD